MGPQRRRQVDAAEADRGHEEPDGGPSRARARSRWSCSGRATTSTRRGRSATSSSAGAPTTSGPATRLPLRARRAARRRRPRPLPAGVDTPIAPLSGGERRRIALARTLLDNPELLLLDEPTNHLDVEGVDWLARHLAARRGTLLVVTHDRWFLDAVCTATWEVADGGVNQYEGGYAAYVLARAERERIEAVREERRQGLLRKELAWLRRGPPARTSKPRFRIEAAEALIAGEPEPRDRAELLRFASSRLGDRVLDAVDVSVAYDGARVLRDATWRLGPGDRIGARRRQRLRQDHADPPALRRSRARRGRGRARRHGPHRAALPGHGGAPRPAARARGARGGARDRDAQRRPRDHAGPLPSASASAARRRARSSVTSRAASAAACS